MSWNILADGAAIQTLAGPIVGIAGTLVAQKCVVNTNTLLEACRQELEEVKTRLNEIPPERRAEIRAAALRGGCQSLEKLENDLLKCSDDRCDLSHRSENSSAWKRYAPLTQLREDIRTLSSGIQRLRMDTYTSTNIVNKGSNRGRTQPRSQRSPDSEHPTAGPSASSSSSVSHKSTTGGSQSTKGRTLVGNQSSGQPEHYPLETITRPTPVHNPAWAREGPELATLPVGLV